MYEVEQPKKQITQFVSEDKSKVSIAFQLDSGTYGMDLYQYDRLIRTTYFPNHSIHFVEDAAENYVMGILK